MVSYDWISIGGGAAGFFGALQYAEAMRTAEKSARILILEASQAPLSKVKISGGGRCNITHHCFDPKELATFYPRGSRELISVFSRYQPKDVWDWFESRGVRLKIEKDGRIFPQSDNSQTVIDLFLREAKRLNIELKYQYSMESLQVVAGGRILVGCVNEDKFEAKSVLVAAGGSRKAWEVLAGLGLNIVEPVPSLFSFNMKDSRLNDLSGRSFQDVEVSMKLGKRTFSARGPLLITHWGLSGPAILKLSSLAARELADADYKNIVMVNFHPDMKRDELIKLFSNLRKKDASKHVKNFGVKGMNSDYWARVLVHLKIWPTMMWSEISNHQMERLADEILRAKFETQGKTTNKEEFVTAGGVSLKEVDFKTMQTKKISGLYLAGEILDIDGVTGGFNFQSAWSTSAIAARAAAAN